jgi:predicted transcriptional regulator
MTLREVARITNARILTGQELLDCEVNSACGSDMMSDVLAHVKDQALLITGLVNPQVVRTALMMDMKCICFVRGKMPDEKVMDIARESNMVIMATSCSMFEACGKLYEAGLRGGTV